MANKPTFSIVALSFQAILIILFGFLVKYGDDALPPQAREGISLNSSAQEQSSNSIKTYYPMFQDVHVMIYVGFGFLMTFLKNYGYGAVGYNFFIAALVCQWATITSGLSNQIIGEGHKHIKIDIKILTSAEFTCGAVLITYGAVLGKVGRLQLLVIGFMEAIFFAINEFINVHYLKIADAGGSIIIHAFGAYFGLAIARILYRASISDNEKEGALYQTDMFAMIGTLFLWMFWPSFNGILVAPDYVAQHRTVINTYYSLAASCVVTFALSPFFQKGYKLNMVHIQNATLAGGVAMGTACNMVVYPWGALLVGLISGTVSTLGYVYLTPFLNKHIKTHDTCGVHNLHGMPGIVGGIAGAIVATNAKAEIYGYEGLFNIWGGRAPKLNSIEYFKLKALGVSFKAGDGLSEKEMGGYQVAALFVTLAIALVGGAVTGLIVKQKVFEPPEDHQLFDDEDFWDKPKSCKIESGLPFDVSS